MSDIHAPSSRQPAPDPPGGPPPLDGYRLRKSLAEAVELEETTSDQKVRQVSFLVFTAVPSTLISAVVHLVLLIMMGLFVIAAQYGAEAISVVVEIDDEQLSEEPLDDLAMEMEVMPAAMETPDPTEALFDSPLLDEENGAAPEIAIDVPEALREVTIADGASGMFVSSAHAGPSQRGGGAAGRGHRRLQALAFGATPESENAVELALKWIIRHQRQDGSWCFNHRKGKIRCRGCRCGNPSHLDSALNGATAMGLLPLLGAGNTHTRGRYRQEVARGLSFLIKSQKSDGSWMEPGGNMYSHGLATLALCEALAMTRGDYQRAMTGAEDIPVAIEQGEAPEVPSDEENDDPYYDASLGYNSPATVDLVDLELAAQLGIEFIEQSQHTGGGWRYSPNQRGDTSVVGWQLMALKSGYLADLQVKPATIKKAVRFLDFVANDSVGSCYGYTSGMRGRGRVRPEADATTAIGLLCRMYTGWQRDRKGIEVGARRISLGARPNKGLYFYYYATQVMHHYGASPWEKWNEWMRDYLVREQCRKGSESGSWMGKGPHDSAGRLYCTSMSAMTLEVYYRYAPIYGAEAVASNAPD